MTLRLTVLRKLTWVRSALGTKTTYSKQGANVSWPCPLRVVWCLMWNTMLQRRNEFTTPCQTLGIRMISKVYVPYKIKTTTPCLELMPYGPLVLQPPDSRFSHKFILLRCRLMKRKFSNNFASTATIGFSVVLQFSHTLFIAFSSLFCWISYGLLFVLEHSSKHLSNNLLLVAVYYRFQVEGFLGCFYQNRS